VEKQDEFGPNMRLFPQRLYNVNTKSTSFAVPSAGVSKMGYQGTSPGQGPVDCSSSGSRHQCRGAAGDTRSVHGAQRDGSSLEVPPDEPLYARPDGRRARHQRPRPRA
jgi:hypothetical protein